MLGVRHIGRFKEGLAVKVFVFSSTLVVVESYTATLDRAESSPCPDGDIYPTSSKGAGNSFAIDCAVDDMPLQVTGQVISIVLEAGSALSLTLALCSDDQLGHH